MTPLKEWYRCTARFEQDPRPMYMQLNDYEVLQYRNDHPRYRFELCAAEEVIVQCDLLKRGMRL